MDSADRTGVDLEEGMLLDEGGKYENRDETGSEKSIRGTKRYCKWC